jgi:hypothetical protein
VIVGGAAQRAKEGKEGEQHGMGATETQQRGHHSARRAPAPWGSE